MIPLVDILFQPVRRIGSFIASCTFEEHHEDTLKVTNYPVQEGADITDHSFKQPERLSIHIGSAQQILNAFKTPAEAYQNLLDLQASRMPLDVVTGKRIYKNMLITEISAVTNADTNSVLRADVSLQSINIVQTQSTTGIGEAINNKSTEEAGTINPWIDEKESLVPNK